MVGYQKQDFRLISGRAFFFKHKKNQIVLSQKYEKDTFLTHLYI